jgi:serine/threonine protein kinase
MGEVYGADDLKLGQRVALKFLPTERGKDQSWRDQFFAEVRMARQVSHPNVCRVYDVGESDGRFFLSMEYVDGEDLASLLRRIGRLPDDKAVGGFGEYRICSIELSFCPATRLHLTAVYLARNSSVLRTAHLDWIHGRRTLCQAHLA